MGIFEKLRPQPRWKHADPAVRATAVFELGSDDTDALLGVAREDADGRVRRAAVTRLGSEEVLADIARSDPDEDVRGDAVRGLAGIAAEADEVARAVDAARALLGLNRTKEIVLVARDSTSAAVRAAVIDLLEDAKALGSISRHAQDAATRLRALARLHDRENILSVALKSPHTDVAVAALERVADVESLTAIAQHGRSKVAMRRARTRLRALEAAAAPADVPAVSMPHDAHVRATGLVADAERVVAMVDPVEAAGLLTATRLAWAELQADVEIDALLAQHFEAASDAAREAIAERQQERAVEDERARAVAREIGRAHV